MKNTAAEEELRTEDKTNDTPVENEKTKISENEKKLTMDTKSESDTKIVQHPVSSNSYRKFSEEILRYPKRIMGFKSESFDIDEICLKTKENYVAYVETTDNMKNIPNPQTILEEENTLSEQTSQEAHATIPVEKDIIESKNTMRRLEEIMNRRMIQNEGRNVKNVFHDENEINIVYNPAQSLKEYLQKLNELKDQTAIDRLNIEKQLTETSSMVEIMKGKNLNMNRKEKQNVENGIEVKENSTDTKPKIEETNRRYGKERSPLKCEDIVIEKRIRKALKTKRTQGIDSTKSMAETTSFDSSGRTSDYNKIYSEYKKPLYEKLLERNREQVSADERKKFEIVQDENLARKKSEAKRKVIISKHKPITKSPSNFSTTRTPKYLLENSSSDIKLRVPAVDGETTESSRIKQKGDIQKILERYTIKNNTRSSINFKKPTEGKLEPKQIKKKNTTTKHQYCLENNLSTDNIQIAKTPENHGKVYSMDGVRQEHLSNISNLSAETSLNINGNTYNKGDLETNHTIENEKDPKIENYKRKLKNLLEPANQYLGKLKKARENRIKTLEQLKMQLKNQFSENIDSMDLKNTLENIPGEKPNTVGKPSHVSQTVNYDTTDNTKRARVIDEENQLLKGINSESDTLNISQPTHMDSGFAGENIVQVEDNEYISSSDKRTEYQKEGIDTTVGIDKRKINEERTPLRNESFQAESITSIHRTPTPHVGTSEHLSILKECNLNENFKLSDIKEISREDSYIKKKEHPSFEEITFCHDLKEGELVLDDPEIVMAETNSRKSACSPNISEGTMKEERESTRNQDSIKIIIYPSDDFVSLHSGEDLMKKHLGNSQNGGTYSKTGEIESLFTEKSRAETHEHISENSSILPKPLIIDQNSMHHQSTINNAKINLTHPSEENTLETLPFSSGMEERNREPISKEFPNSSHTSETSECFVILHDNLKPQIRRNYPSPTRPRNNTDKKEKPKSKKDVILPPPKDKQIPKTVGCMKNSKSSKEGDEDIRNTNKDESITEDNEREKMRQKFLIEDKLKLDDNNSRSTKIGEAIDDVGKHDLEDLIFNYRSKPKHWREQWEITYKDETNSTPIEICERMKLADEIENREVFEKIEITQANHVTCKTTLPTSLNPTYEVTPNKKTGKKELKFFKISKDRHSKKSELIKKSQTENTSELIVSGELEHEGNTEPQLISLESSKNAGGMYPAKHDYANPNQLKNEKTKALRNISPNPVKIHTRNDVNVMNLDNIPNKKSQIQEGADEPMILKERKWPPKLKKSKTSYGKLYQNKSSSQEISKIKLSKKKILVPNKTLCSSNLLKPSGTLKVSDGNAPESSFLPQKNKLRQSTASNYLEENLKNWNISKMSPKEYSYPAEPDISLPRNIPPRPQNAILNDDEKKISNVRHGNINTRRSATTDHQPEGAPRNNSQGSKERSSERKVNPNKYPNMKANYYDSHQDNKKIQKIVENYEIIPDSNYIKDTRIPKSLRSRPNSTKVSQRLESSDEKNRQTSPLSRAGKRSELTAKSNLLDENLKLSKISKSNSIGKGDSIIAKNRAKLENMTQRMKTSDFSIDNEGSKLGSSSIPKSEEDKQIFESAKSHITTSDVDQNPPATISPLMHMFLLDENEQSERCIVSKKQDEHYNNRNESIPYSRKENTFPGNSNSSSCGQNGATKKQLEQKCNPEQHELPFFQKKLNRTQSTSLNKKVKRRYCNENFAKPYKKLKTLDTPEITPKFPEELNGQEKASHSREFKGNEEMISTEPSLPKLQKKNFLVETEQIRSDDKRQTENDQSSNMSLEKQLVMEKTNDCKYGQNSEVPISDKLESGQKTSCMGVVTFTFSNIHNGYSQKDELEKIEVSAKGNFEKIIGSDELSTDVENEKLLLTSNCRIDCNYMSPGIDFEHNEKNCEDHPEDSGGNGGSGKDTSKLVLKVMLPKHPCAFQFEKKSKLVKTENGQSTDGTTPQKKKCHISKDEAVPGKLKKKAIIKLNRNFESSKKRPLGKFRSKPHPLEVSKTEHGKDNSKIKEREEIDRFKTERSEVNEGIFGKKVIDLEDMYASVHLKIIMNKYRVDTEQLHYLNDQNVGLPEVEILERKNSRENISKAFNEDIRKKHNETIRNEIKCFDENVGTNDSMAMKKIITVDDQSYSGVQYRSKSRNKTRVNYLEGASNRKIDNDQNNRKIGGIYNKFKSNAQDSHLTLGNKKERHTRNTSNTPSATSMKDRESESIRNETNSSDSLQYQLEYVNRLKKQTPENGNKRGKGFSDNKIYDKTGFGEQGELMRKLNVEKYNLQNIVKEYMVFEIKAKNYPNKYLLEYQVPACFLDSAESKRMKENTSGKETIKNMIFHEPSQSTYLLERQVLTQKLTPKRKQEAGVSIINNSHEIPNDSKNAPNIEFINQIEKERRDISEATIEEILPKKKKITEPVDFGKNIVGTYFSTLFPCKIIGLEEYHKRRLVAKIEKIFDLKNKNTSSDSRNEGNFILNYKSMCKSDQKSMKSRSFNKFFVADQKNKIENSEGKTIRDEQFKKNYRKVRSTVLDLANVEKNRNLGPASRNESIVLKQKKYTTKIYSPENNNVCYTKAVVEKVLPVYPPKQQDTLKRPVTKFCHQVQIPPQSISEVFFSQPCYDINTLSKKNRSVPVISISKKYDRNFEKQNNITFLKIRKDEKNENKHSLPALIPRTQKDYEFGKNREHILKLRYELLKKLQNEFKFFNDNQVVETLQNCKKRNGTQEFASVDYKEKRDFPIEQTKPKNNTEKLLEKLSKNDPSNGKYDSKESKGDPEKK